MYMATVGWSKARTMIWRRIFPSFAYRQYCDSRRGAGADSPAELYASLAITSGGYRQDETMPIPEVIAQNTDYGAALRELFEAHGVPSKDVVIPSELGGMRNASWGQLDFLMLWFHAMAGVTIEQAVAIEKELMSGSYSERVYGPGKWEQNDKLRGLSPDETWQRYEAFTRKYAEALDAHPDYHAEMQAVRGVVGALDNHLSLGCRAEKMLADHLCLPFYELEVQEGWAPDRLRSHVEKLDGLGATAVRLTRAPGPSMVLHPIDD